MRFLRYAFLLSVVLAGALAFAQRSEDWLPVTRADLDYKQVPAMPGAAAVRLYYADHVDLPALSEVVYERIKILTDAGLKYAEVEVPARPQGGFIGQLSDLKARMVKPDGSIVEVAPKVSDKMSRDERGEVRKVKAFSFPEVTAGTILEYKVVYAAPQGDTEQGEYFASGGSRSVPMMRGGAQARDAFKEWVLQSELYTVKESFRLKLFDVRSVYAPQDKPVQIGDVLFNWKDKPKENGNEMVLEVQNVPGYVLEDYMPPDNLWRSSVLLFYAHKASSVDKEWEEIAKERYQQVEEFLSKNRGIREAATEAIGSEANPEQKLRKLYLRAQNLRNLSFEKPDADRKNLQRNENVGDVLLHGYGSDGEITEVFVALARAAGFDASIVQISDRTSRIFSKEWTSLIQVSKMIAVVKQAGAADVYLDPGTRFCPFGMLRWANTQTEGLKLDKQSVVWVKPPAYGYDKNLMARTETLSLATDGTLAGDVVVEFKGQDALERRLAAIAWDEAERKSAMEKELKEALPAGSSVQMTQSKGWEASEEELMLRFNISVPKYAVQSDKSFGIPMFPFQGRLARALTQPTRKFPVYLPFPFSESDVLSLSLPAGAVAQAAPDRQDVRLKMARYQSVAEASGGTLMTQRRLDFNGIFFPLEQYSDLKTFFGKVQSADGQQIPVSGVKLAEK